MPDNGTQNYSLPINGSYTIQEGYHSGQGKVTQSVTTMKGSSVTPNTSVTTIATDQKYINGNFTIPAFALPSPSILKKGAIYTIYGKSVEGQFEGWVPTPQDLYYNGVFNMGYYTLDTVMWRAENTRLLKIDSHTNAQDNFLSNLNINVTSYSQIIFEGLLGKKFASSPNKSRINITVMTDIGGIFFVDYTNSSVAQASINISQAKTLSSITCYMNINSYITRIRLA